MRHHRSPTAGRNFLALFLQEYAGLSAGCADVSKGFVKELATMQKNLKRKFANLVNFTLL
jgi:hypothetical protein